MRKLAGAKEKLGLRCHGLVVGSPEKARADPAVLRSLCTNYLPNGKVETLVSRFENWASVKVCVWGGGGARGGLRGMSYGAVLEDLPDAWPSARLLVIRPWLPALLCPHGPHNGPPLSPCFNTCCLPCPAHMSA